jgi:hypothetical protein
MKFTPTVLAFSVAATTLAAWQPVHAHHGFGRFDRANDAMFEGTITSIDFVNPHAYLYFDMPTDSGEIIAMRCEMRAATLMRRSGWSKEMFAPGLPVTIYGFKHRTDPGSCYVEEITIGEAPTLNRNDQLDTGTLDLSSRLTHLPSGDPNITGDWAQEQYVIARPPSGENIGLVPKSMKPGIEAGTIPPTNIPGNGWFPPPVALTARGQAEADAHQGDSVAANPRLRCEPTSIIFDWVFDGPVNRITQEEDRIVINYGLYSFERVIHMDMDSHPANIALSYAGHSIGHWEAGTNDNEHVLVVDTIGIEPGIISAPVKHSDQLHVVERYTLNTDTWTLTRNYVAEDPVYLAEPYVGRDVVLLSEVPYEKHACDELTFEFLEDQVR